MVNMVNDTESAAVLDWRHLRLLAQERAMMLPQSRWLYSPETDLALVRVAFDQSP